MNTAHKTLQNKPKKETQVERCRRILGAVPKVKAAAKLFDYTEATARAKRRHP